MFPVGWALMEEKTTQAYYDVIHLFSVQNPQIRPVTILGDYENAIRNAALQVYDQANFLGCNTHYKRVSIFYITLLTP